MKTFKTRMLTLSWKVLLFSIVCFIGLYFTSLREGLFSGIFTIFIMFFLFSFIQTWYITIDENIFRCLNLYKKAIHNIPISHIQSVEKIGKTRLRINHYNGFLIIEPVDKVVIYEELKKHNSAITAK